MPSHSSEDGQKVTNNTPQIMIPTTTPLCDCGKPVDPDMLDLATMFPKIVKATQCQQCASKSSAAEAEIARRDRERAETNQRAARLECIPPEIRRTRINFPSFNAALWLRVERWRPSDLEWLGIVGKPGHCKTRCLGVLVERLIMDGHRVMWTTALEFQDRVDEMRSDTRSVVAEARAYFRQVKSSAILVLDDLGKNTWNPSMERYLFDVVDHRKTHDLPILWTSNTHPIDILKSGDLTKDRAGALIGRLLEASRIEPV